MRSDTNLNQRFAAEGVDVRQYGAMPGVLDTNTEVDGQRVLRSHSFSGREANSVFYNRAGKGFDDLSGVTGLDGIADGRAFAFFDYDRDGQTDVVLTNSNDPQLQLFRNELPAENRWIKVRLVGGGEGMTNRDGYGAHVVVETEGQSLRRELRCGDGFAAQNSRTLTIGIGDAEHATVRVLWPTGKTTEIPGVAAGHLVTVREREGAAVLARVEPTELAARPTSTPGETLDLGLGKRALIVNMATWCAVCRSEIPHLKRLAEDVAGELAFYGLPVDPEDTAEKLEKYSTEAEPPYQILAETTPEQRGRMAAVLKANFGDTPLPSSVLIDAEGRVLKAFKGTPTLSDVRALTVQP